MLYLGVIGVIGEIGYRLHCVGDVGAGGEGLEGEGEGHGGGGDGDDGGETGRQKLFAFADASAEGYHGNALTLAALEDACRGLAHQCLAVEAAFAGDDERGAGDDVVKADFVEYGRCAGLEFGSEEGCKSASESAGGAGSGRGVEVDAAAAADKLGE